MSLLGTNQTDSEEECGSVTTIQNQTNLSLYSGLGRKKLARSSSAPRGFTPYKNLMIARSNSETTLPRPKKLHINLTPLQTGPSSASGFGPRYSPMTPHVLFPRGQSNAALTPGTA